MKEKTTQMEDSVKRSIWLISGRSLSAIMISHALPQRTMEDYKKGRGDMTDKQLVERPAKVKFPREMRQYLVGSAMQVFHMEAADETKPILLYIHGGAYLNNFADLHWKAMAEWAKATGCGIVTPNYPLLYRYTAVDAHPLMLLLYKQLLEKYDAKRIIIAGDSAGGGFALAFAQTLRDKGLPIPAKLILISPWVGVIGGDDSIQEHDTFLNAEVLRCVGKDWAKDIDPRTPMISPLYGDMNGLPPTELFTGTWEIFYTDIKALNEKMKAAGVEVNLHIAPKMGHVYPLWPCPEGKIARLKIRKIINEAHPCS